MSNRPDQIDELWVLEALKSQKAEAVKLVKEFVDEVVAASQKARMSNLFVTDTGSIVKGNQLLKEAVDNIKAQKVATDALNAAKKQELDIEKLFAAIKTQNAKTSAEQAKEDKIRLDIIIALTKELERLAAMSAKAEAQNKKDQSAYEQLKRTYNETAKAVLDLGVRVGVTDKEFISAAADLKKMHDQLYAVESAIGRNQRNVGNYASAFNGLGNAINQISRELPSFTNSMQTGFLAISNNLPILFDELERVRQKNAELKAQGEVTIPVWKQLAGAIFSWQTALSVAITLLVTEGPKLIEYLTGSGDAAKEATAYIESYTRALQSMSAEASTADDLLNNAQEIEISRAKASGASEEQITKMTLQALDDRHKANGLYIIKLKQQIKEFDEWGQQNIIDNPDVSPDSDRYKSYVSQHDALQSQLAAAQKTGANLAKQYQTTYYNDISRMRKENEEGEKKAQEEARKRAEERKKLSDTELKYQYDTQKQELENEISIQQKISDNEDADMNERYKSLEEMYRLKVNLIDATADYEATVGKKSTAELKEIDNQRILSLRKLFQEAQSWGDKFKTKDEKGESVPTATTAAMFRGIGKGFEDAWKDRLERTKKLMETFGKDALIILNVIDDGYKSSAQRRTKALDDESDKVEKDRQRQIDGLKYLSLTEQAKADKTAEINAQAAAQDARIQNDRKKEAAKEVQFEREAAIAKAVLNLYLGVAKEIGGKGVVGIATGAAIFAFIGSLVAAMTSVKTPTLYAKGGTHKGGAAIAGEAGAEMVHEPGKNPYVIDQATYYPDAPAGTVFTPLKTKDDWMMTQTAAPAYNKGTQTQQVVHKPVSTTTIIVDKDGIRKITQHGSWTQRRIIDKISK